MDSDQGKLFIGGISWETSEEKMREYFSKYGEVVQTVIMTDKMTGRPRGFGFVVFADPSILDRVLLDKHTIDGRTVEAKRALSREEQQTSTRSANPNAGKSFASGGNIRTKKIFVGGLPPTLTEEGFRQYFENYGTVTDVVVMYDQSTQRPRGFGFISFDTEDAVDRVLHKSFHDLNGKLVEVKRALPKDANPGGGGRTMGSGGYQGYGSSGGNTSTYDSRMEANRYIQPQAAGGGYPTYGSSGYGAPGYGYGAANNPVGYGGYSVGGYGSANAAYGAPAGAYGNPNAPNAGYVSGPPGAPRSPWNNQAPSGYGSSGYGGNTGYGAAGWSATGMGSGGTGSTPTGQSPSATAGYGNQGYGYGGYGGSEGSYANVNSYGAVGGRAAGAPNSNVGGSGADQQGASAGYMGGGYGDTNGNSGYPNSGWRADPSQGGGYGAAQTNGPPSGQVGYGGGYGSAASRQAQQQ
ncbi:heterogeneous nuclear ribonucleoprotein 1-like protein [Cinnamomum micranthum f. kanehirae]|uniref:Heterogeneous nuclear ribonucleoprotein 1-like protein n=1 Tax=Cinnamomum micranthum f. kanehirae TaxID=337451 RepID=A0A3S3Q879_9MAGN|nr:heterogeneous nuclear ribonucleoprotein 1-like protein [Cinnamomum micranthum f. kanehirae]